MKPRVYLETTIPSYLTAWPSRDLVRAAHQQITVESWSQRRGNCDLFISQAVVRECEAGNPVASAERMKLLRDLALLEETDEAIALVQLWSTKFRYLQGRPSMRFTLLSRSSTEWITSSRGIAPTSPTPR